MNSTHIEIRYAQRLSERTSRLYRRVQTIATFLQVALGSAAFIAFTQANQSAGTYASLALAVISAFMLSVRPGEKAATWDADYRKYTTLLSVVRDLDDEASQKRLDEARRTDAQEVEGLRMVAYNDVIQEIGSTSAPEPLTWTQRTLAVLA